ncbi:hypothetical protein QUF61_12550 [Candidatus Venteria ishoeyi]|uniref:hypothetical protein n=1 Tax=Candidatus Venteria ishoeyi TaxID=1899563 RepID=UPI0025A5E084|nr:hypothetical protein [Candidatus Venteria ishoeyi]MDM8547319.1 hypothetical protein [Candidatus Venteria ishoeyi]
MEAYKAVKARFSKARDEKASLYWPLPSVYETANIIAHVNDGNQRKVLADKLQQKITRSFEATSWLTVTPSCECEQERLFKFLQEFSNTYAPQKIGLVDATMIFEANRLKNKNNKVHIWTVDKALKNYEPDKEKNPFCGWQNN